MPSLFTRIFGRTKAAAPAVTREATAQPAPPEPSTPRTGGISVLWPSYVGDTALCVATVYRCVRLLAEKVANLSVQVMKRKDGVFVDDYASRLAYLLNVQPDPNINAFDFWAQVVENTLMGEGNAYIVPFISPVAMDYDRLALCGRGTVVYDDINDKYTVTDTVNGIFGTFDEDEIIHIKGLTTNNPKKGVSVLTYARLVLDIASAGDGETYNRFVNGGNVRGLITNDSSVRGFGEYQDAELSKTASSIDGKFRTGERIVSLPGQVEFKQLSLSSTDMQFLESRKFTVRDICRFFGVPPSFVFDDTSNNYKSAEMASVDFLSNTLDPLLKKIETELQRKLFTPSQYGRRKIQFDRRGLYACDLNSRVKYQAATIAAGIYTVNEWRREENKPTVEGGDKVLVSANLKGIDDLGTGPAAAPAEPEKSENDEE